MVNLTEVNYGNEAENGSDSLDTESNFLGHKKIQMSFMHWLICSNAKIRGGEKIIGSIIPGLVSRTVYGFEEGRENIKNDYFDN